MPHAPRQPQAVQVGPLTFDLFREGGLIREVVVRAQGSTESIAFVPGGGPRLEPLHHTIGRVVENLYSSAQWPDRIRELLQMTGKSGEEAARVERAIDWASRHGPQIRAVAYKVMPGLNPFRILPEEPSEDPSSP